MSDAPSFRPRVQVASGEHYTSEEYLTPERFFSYGLQVELTRSLEPRTILEIGPGPGIVAYALRLSGHRVVTLDLDPRLDPDTVGDLGHLPLADGSVDAVLCAEVLEHVPFDHARSALAEFRRVARRGAVVSVPDIRPFYHVNLVLPGIRWEGRSGVPWHRPPATAGADEHHWVLGIRDHPPERLREAARDAGWTIAEERRPVEHAYHHFFVLR